MDENPRVDAPRTWADYTAVVRRRWWILASGVVLGLLGGIVYAQTQPKVYESSTAVLVQSTGVPESGQPVGARSVSGINLDTQAQLVKSEVVANAAKELLDSNSTANALRGRVSVKVPPNTQVLTITFRAGTPKKARAGSHAFAQAYLDQRAADAKKDLDAQISALQQQKATIEGQLATVSEKLVTLSRDSAEREKAESSQKVLSDQITSIGTRLIPLQTTQITPGSIISDARLPSRPTSPNVFLTVVSSTFGGLLLGLLLTLLAERVDRRVHSGFQVRRHVDLPLLVDVPPGQLPSGVAGRSSPEARHFTQLRNAVLAALGHRVQTGRARSNVVLLLGVAPGAAPGVVAANFCATLARSGQRVTLLTTNPQSDSPAILGVGGRHGLADVLRGEVGIGEVQQLSPVCPDVHVVVAGTRAESEEFVPERLGSIVYALAAYSGYLVIETSPARSSVDGQALACFAQLSFAVVELRRSRRQDIDEAVQQFQQVGSPLAGLAVVPELSRRLPVRPVRAESGTPAAATPPAAPTVAVPRVAAPRPASRPPARGTATPRIPTPRP